MIIFGTRTSFLNECMCKMILLGDLDTVVVFQQLNILLLLNIVLRFTEVRFDDAAMESSYAQQEFEEKRRCVLVYHVHYDVGLVEVDVFFNVGMLKHSSRLGQLEDEEELRREQGQVSRKRKKTGGKEKVSNSKQIKLNFK